VEIKVVPSVPTVPTSLILGVLSSGNRGFSSGSIESIIIENFLGQLGQPLFPLENIQ